MSEIIINEIILTLLIFGIFGISLAGVYFKKKYNVTKEDMELLETMLNISDYIVSKFEFKHSNKLSEVVKYSLEAIEFIDEYEYIEDFEIKIDLIKQKAVRICEENELVIEDGFVEVIDEIIEYICNR